ncbi:uncharacterized protein [Miscanthus floridulus]|uniref:uncharacterized protein n=1 Tax=Miscanthus floridulus TaxID=154761 RepID=UPI003458DBA7
MAAYCREVRRLEEKFDRLELNHIPRRDNEAADALAKIMSNWDSVPTGVFASDQDQPMVRYGEAGGVGGLPPPPERGADRPLSGADPSVALAAFVVLQANEDMGLDLVGPLKRAPGGYTHLLVTVDKFSKWIEARPISRIRSEEAMTFFTNIIHRFGVPNSIIIDNGTQFTGKKFLNFCDKNHIQVDWAAVAHPRTNGQVEHANDMILRGLKPWIFNRLNQYGKRWVAELPLVV